MTAGPTSGAVATAGPPRSGAAAPSDETLADVLREFACTMLPDASVHAILDRLVQRIVDLLAVTSAGAVLVSGTDDPHHVAASDASACRFVRRQVDLWEGPCITAYETGGSVSVPDLSDHHPMTALCSPVIVGGVAAVFSFPLLDGGVPLGALDLYRDTPGPLDEAVAAAAETLADVSAAYIVNARTQVELLADAARSRTLSMHDALTGLPNRVLLLERLDHAVQRSCRSSKVTAVLFADLDDFKNVNDRHGHRVGDELLVQVARRLETVIRPGDTLARISGDEFVVLCEDLDDVSEADEIAARLVEAMTQPFFPPVGLSVSVGVASSRRGDGLSEHLLELSDKAMYQAKRNGGGRHQFFDGSPDRNPQMPPQPVSLDRTVPDL